MDKIDIEQLREMCRNKEIKWTDHVMQRIEERGLSRNDVICCIMSGEIIEQYPTSFPFPSCLILGAAVTNEHMHVVAAVGGYKVRIMTAYRPDTDKWKPDMKTRKGA